MLQKPRWETTSDHNTGFVTLTFHTCRPHVGFIHGEKVSAIRLEIKSDSFCKNAHRPHLLKLPDLACICTGDRKSNRSAHNSTKCIMLANKAQLNEYGLLKDALKYKYSFCGINSNFRIRVWKCKNSREPIGFFAPYLAECIRGEWGYRKERAQRWECGSFTVMNSVVTCQMLVCTYERLCWAVTHNRKAIIEKSCVPAVWIEQAADREWQLSEILKFPLAMMDKDQTFCLHATSNGGASNSQKTKQLQILPLIFIHLFCLSLLKA